jgi:hypothetical protein
LASSPLFFRSLPPPEPNPAPCRGPTAAELLPPCATTLFASWPHATHRFGLSNSKIIISGRLCGLLPFRPSISIDHHKNTQLNSPRRSHLTSLLIWCLCVGTRRLKDNYERRTGVCTAKRGLYADYLSFCRDNCKPRPSSSSAINVYTSIACSPTSPRRRHHNHNNDNCQHTGVETSNNSAFGKVFKKVFPGVETRRLGKRSSNMTFYHDFARKGTRKSAEASPSFCCWFRVCGTVACVRKR